MTSFLPFWNKPATPQEKEDPIFPTLTFKERVLAFLTCFILGMVLEVLSFGSVFGIFVGSPTRFALTYTLGNLLSVVGIGFLFGFKQQFKSMTNKTRLFTCIIFITSLIMTLISALIFKKPILVLLFLIIQVCAYVWYVASYIPFARDCMTSCFKKIANY